MNFEAMTLGEARRWLASKLGNGIACPCCGQFAKVYRRRLNAGMALSLVQMYRSGGTDYVDVTRVCNRRGREEGKLRFWGLIEEATERREDGGRAGWWRVTPKGVQFAHGRLPVNSYARVYNNHLLGFDGNLVTIAECLGRPFNLDELMEDWRNDENE